MYSTLQASLWRRITQTIYIASKNTGDLRMKQMFDASEKLIAYLLNPCNVVVQWSHHSLVQ